MNVLFPISFNFQVRYLIRTELLDKLKKFCTPIILLTWNQPDLFQELSDKGYKVVSFDFEPENREMAEIRKRVDKYYLKTHLKSKTYPLIERHKYATLRLKSKVKYWISRFKYHGYKKSDFEQDIITLSSLKKASNDWIKLKALFEDYQIEYVYTSAPFLMTEEFICRVANELNLPIYYSVLSFDNLTTRGYLPFVPARASVWNTANKEQLIRAYGNQIADFVDITGPPQFDFYFDNRWVIVENQWRNEKNIPANRQVIMYGANSKYFVPNEFRIIKLIDEAIDSGQILNNPIILLRPHPTDSYSDWEEMVKTLKHTFIEKSIQQNESESRAHNKYSNFTNQDIKSLCSTLQHSCIHISYASTLTLDGICFNKPQICPYFSPAPLILKHSLIRNLYKTEHYLPIMKSGAVLLPNNEMELIQAINQSMSEPNKLKDKREALKRTYLNNTNGMSVELLKQSFLKFLYSTK